MANPLRPRVRQIGRLSPSLNAFRCSQKMSAILLDSVHPSCENMSDATQLLTAVEQGEPQAAEKLLDLVYDELRRLASAKMAQQA